MPITEITTDPDALTMTVIADYDVPVQRLWQAYADPRQIERFWGPPEWPATFTRHDMIVGGRSDYFMTGPDGERAAGYWEFEAIDEGRSFTVRDGFTREDGTADEALPSMVVEMRFEPTPSGARFSALTTFPSVDAIEQLIDMGMREGMEAAMSQVPDVLADLASFAAGRATDSQILTDTKVRISRVIRGSVDHVWHAHHDASSLQQWLLGPDGWTMPVCEVADGIGDTYRYEWQSEDGEQRFGFEGELLESIAPTRAVTTERMVGTDGPETHNEMTLTEVDGGTLISIVITYPDAELRDQILGSGMVDGMESSYARLEAGLAATIT